MCQSTENPHSCLSAQVSGTSLSLHDNKKCPQSSKALEIKINGTVMKLTSLCYAKENINTTKRQPTEWEKIFANHATEGLNLQNR